MQHNTILLKHASNTVLQHNTILLKRATLNFQMLIIFLDKCKFKYVDNALGKYIVNKNTSQTAVTIHWYRFVSTIKCD